jgi:hypothetical protein
LFKNTKKAYRQATVRQMRNSCTILVGKSEGKNHLGDPSRLQMGDNFEAGLNETGRVNTD